ncbi:hypothetical protein F5Y11DRAFT_361863 [Daldinia sp. FL1419]|nr:hypothetical protein F5Y11DRAFT_361863 [Daldinia sp. FL1419]
MNRSNPPKPLKLLKSALRNSSRFNEGKATPSPHHVTFGGAFDAETGDDVPPSPRTREQFYRAAHNRRWSAIIEERVAKRMAQIVEERARKKEEEERQKEREIQTLKNWQEDVEIWERQLIESEEEYKIKMSKEAEEREKERERRETGWVTRCLQALYLV